MRARCCCVAWMRSACRCAHIPKCCAFRGRSPTWSAATTSRSITWPRPFSIGCSIGMVPARTRRRMKCGRCPLDHRRDTVSMKEKLKAIKEAIGSIEKQFGKGAIMALGQHRAEQVPVIATGCPSLDQALGCGGYPRGRIVEVYGPESSGKTTLTLHAIAECQRAGGVAAFIDAEHALDVAYARAL